MAYKQPELDRMDNQQIVEELREKQQKLMELAKVKADLQVYQRNSAQVDSELKEGRYEGGEKARKEAEREDYKSKMDVMKTHDDTTPSKSVIYQRGQIKGEIAQLEVECVKRNIKIDVRPDVGQEGQQGQTTDAQTQTQEKRLAFHKAFAKSPDNAGITTEEKQPTQPNTVLKVTKTSKTHSSPDKDIEM